ncbi:MAG: hypothetical protein ACSLFJ_13350 [Immundisolibacter sp.]|uniref:hypothetical protein n=1 Tax=Immundisolibacter sp. TaxID=1934948 RepID=UPI003EE09524
MRNRCFRINLTVAQPEARLAAKDNTKHIPIGAEHRLENLGRIPLRIIEVQSDSYLDGDDIIRFDDCYERHRR